MLQDKIKSNADKEKVKLRTSNLRPGMYVCELDRPWEDSPFLLQGFELKNQADVEAVMKCCEYVFIDVRRTAVVNMTIQAPPTGFLPWNKEIESAEDTRKQTSDLIKSFIDEVRFGQSLDIQLAKSAVSECVASVVRNPDAMMFMTQLKRKDEYSSQHAFNVCIYSIILGRLAGLGGKDLDDLGTCGLLHDFGKVTTPVEILNKKDVLTPEEWVIMKQHTTRGRDILMSGRNIFSGTVDVAYGHHENLDGSGYPRGLTESQLTLNTKIVAVVEKYDAITSPRPYRDSRDHLYGIGALTKLVKNHHIDVVLTNRFINYLGVYPPGSIVGLSSGDVAIVLESNPKQRLHPQVLVVRDSDKNPVERYVDMGKAELGGGPCKITVVHDPGAFGIDISQYRDAIMRATL